MNYMLKSRNLMYKHMSCMTEMTNVDLSYIDGTFVDIGLGLIGHSASGGGL